MSGFVKDALERILWTALQAAVATAAAIVAELDYVWVPVLTVALTTVKTWVAGKVSGGESAGLGGPQQV